VEWLQAGIAIANQGENVIFIRDTAYADTPLLPNMPICPEASVDLDRRLALYSVAKTNLGVVNGPMGLCWATTHIPHITMWKDAPNYPCYDHDWLKNYVGFAWGEQFPWNDPTNQKIVWKDDTRENILDAYFSVFQRAGLAA
jgi:hypothetical protein